MTGTPVWRGLGEGYSDPMTAPSDPPGFRDHVGLSIDDASDGRASATLAVRPEHLNAHGSVHGGAIATLCDSAMGTALAASGTEHPVTWT